MPKSKRDKKISLTKTDKKGLALKQKIVDDIRSCVQKYKSVYVFTYKNLRNEHMQEVRNQWKPSRFFFGKNRVLALALGKTPEDEVEEGLHKLSATLEGQCGLLFTDCTRKEVTEWFESYSVEDYARSGFKANVSITLPEGPLKQFAHSIEPYLRQLGMPTKLEKGVVTLIKDFEVCKKGDILKPEQATILKLLEHKLSEFRLVLKACYTKSKGFERFAEVDKENNSEDEEEDVNNDDDDEMEAD